MKRILALFAALLYVTAAQAQWQTPNHSVPVGKGGGNIGFSFAAPGTSGQPLASNGASADPSFQGLGNAGFASVPANTYKCNPTGGTAVIQDCPIASVFTGDVPPAAGVAGLVPAPPSGATAANRLLGAGGTFVDRKPLFGFVQPPPLTAVGFPEQVQIAPKTLNGSGIGSATMSMTPTDLFHNITRQAGSNLLRAYVDPVNGTDTGTTCASASPCKTLQYCITNCTATNIVGVVTGPFSPFSFNGGTATNPIHRISFDGPATVRVNGSPYIDPTAMTFSVTSGAVYQATLSLTGSAFVQRWSYSDTYDLGTGNLTRFPQYASLAALQAASNASPGSVFGWFYSANTIYVAFFGLNVQSFRAKMLAYYADTTGDASVSLIGGVTLLVDAQYQLNMDGVSFEYSNNGASTPNLLIEGRGYIKQFVALANGVHGAGGFSYISGMDCEASSDDCFNFDPSGGTGTSGMAIGHNVKGWYAGDIGTFGTGIANNKNGWSAHGGVDDIVVGSSFGKNFGPNVADTSTIGYTSNSWFVGVETLQSSDGTDAGFGFFGIAGQPTAIRQTWLDTCLTMQEVASLTGDQTATIVKTTNGAYNVPPAVTNGATISNYTRNAP